MLKKTVFIIILISFVFIISEFAFRVMYSVRYHNNYMLYGLKNVFKYDMDSKKGYRKLRKAEGIFFKGFRTPPFPMIKPEGEYRIVTLGGSSTYGIDGGYYQSWPYLLSKKLNCRVINAGISGQTTNGANRLLENEV